MENFWIKALILVVIAVVLYREILKSAKNHSSTATSPSDKAGFIHLILVGIVVAVFTYAGMSITWIETRDLRPYHPEKSPQIVGMFDPGVIEVNGMFIKTNLARKGELKNLSARLVEGCGGDDGCEAQKLFDYVTAIPYRTDYTSRNAREVIRSGWGDCDDKSNLFASLLNERGIDYWFIYVPKHVFVAVHLKDDSALPFIRASLDEGGKRYYYAETTATGAKIGEFNGQFPSAFEGIYDLEHHREIDPHDLHFRMF